MQTAAAKQLHPQLQQSRHTHSFSKAGTFAASAKQLARSFGKAATPAAATSCRHVNRKHESGCKGECPGEAFNQSDLA